MALIYPAARLVGRRPGLLAAFVVAIAPFHVYYAQETRMCALITLLALLLVLCVLRLSAAPRRPGLWLGYLLTAVAAIYTHYYAFFVLLALNLFILAAWRRRRPLLIRWLLAQGLLAVAYVPWIVIQAGLLAGQAQARLEELGPAGLGRIVGPSLIAFSVGTTVEGPLAWGLTLGILFWVVLGAIALLRDPDRRPTGALLLLYLLVPMAMAWLTRPLMPFFFQRFLLLVTPAYYLLLALGLGVTGRRVPWLTALGLALVVGASGYSLRNYYDDTRFAKGGYGRLISHIQAHARPGDAIIMNNPDQRALFDYYRPEGIPAYMFPRAYPLEDPRTEADLREIAQRHPRLWLIIFGNPAPYDPNRFIERWLSRHGAKSYHGDFVDAGLDLYVMAPAPAAEEQPLRANFAGRIELLGYSLTPQEVAPGQILRLTLHWRALGSMERRYTVFTHLIDGQERIWAQMDSEPVGGTHPTVEWVPGEEVWDNYGLEVSPQAPPGEYRIEVGWYYLPTLERLPVLDEGGRIVGDRVLLPTAVVVGP